MRLTLYICYFGIREPLVQTQVLPYIREIMKDGVRFTLLTFEPKRGENDLKEFVGIKDALEQEGIDWQWLPYHKRFSALATAWDIFRGAVFIRSYIARERPDVLHGRVHVPTLMGALARKFSRRKPKLLFDIRGFMPEEYTDAGIWPEGGILYRTAKRVEWWLMKEADGFVVLTEKAREILFPESKDTGRDHLGRPVEVIPCCVDMSRFASATPETRDRMRNELGIDGRFVMAYVGAFGGWYLTEETADLLGVLKHDDPRAFAMILTQSKPEMIEPLLRERGFQDGDYLMKNEQEKVRVKIIVSDIDKSLGFEWLVDRIRKDCFELSFILLNSGPSHLGDFLKSAGIQVDELRFRGKKDIPILISRVARILLRDRPLVVHSHLFAANLIGQTAALITRRKKRIYTRHSSNENRRYHGKQWIDHIVNRMATHIVAISKNVSTILQNEEGVPIKKIRLIHHGFDLDRFINVPNESTAAAAAKYNPGSRSPVIGVIARYSHWKGIQYIIPAFHDLLDCYPDALLVLANARRGDFKERIAEQLATLPAESFIEIEFEHDLFALYSIFDVYVHAPIDSELEAFGQTYIEALAAGIPSVFTLSGVAPEFIRHEVNALVVPFQNSIEIGAALRRLLNDKALCAALAANGRRDVGEMFRIETMISKLEDLYVE